MFMNPEIESILTERFSKDCLIALATAQGDTPYVRAVNAYYMNGAFYCVTHLMSNKMKQIAANDRVALCGEWFTGQGRAKSLGHVLRAENQAIMEILRPAFASWYSNGHVDESDENTILLKIALIGGVLMSHGRRFVW